MGRGKAIGTEGALPMCSSSLSSALLCGLGTVPRPLWASGSTWGAGPGSLTPIPRGCSPGAGPACQRHRSSSAGGCGGGAGGPGWTMGRSPWAGATVGELPLRPPGPRRRLRPQLPLHPRQPPGVLPVLATHRTCAGSARVSGPRWSRGVLHKRQGVPGSEGTRNRRRLTR